MLRREGELDGVRILSPRTVRLMRANHLPGGQDIAQLSRDLVVIFMTQLTPARAFDFRGQLRSLVYSALAD